MSLFENTEFNNTLLAALYLQIEDTWSLTREFLDSCVSSLHIENIGKSIVIVEDLSFYGDFAEAFYFNEFQVTLLKTFLLILAVTLFFIFVSWKVYGNRISERFVKIASRATIEQLKESVSKLKLPKEHTPRI